MDRFPMAKTHRVALLLPKGHEYAARLIEGVVDFARDHADFEFVEVLFDEDCAPPAVYHIEADGALVWAHHGNSWVLDLRDRGLRLVSLNGDWAAEEIPCVAFDLEAMLDTAVEHLAGLNRRHAAYVGHLTSRNPSKVRWRDGFLERARERGWTTAALEIPGIPSEERDRLARPEDERELIDFLRGQKKPVVIHCDDDYVGVLVCRVAAHLGLTVPEEVAVLGTFDLALTRFSSPTLSSLPMPGQLVGAAGMRLMSAFLSGGPVDHTKVLVKPPPVASRESTACSIVRDDDIRRARRYIEELACQGLTVEQLLQRLDISQKTLNKRFAVVYGETPGQAIQRLKIERAKQWLGTTNLSITRIADMCGFGEPSNFDRFFRRAAGCTPSEYRERSQPRLGQND